MSNYGIKLFLLSEIMIPAQLLILTKVPNSHIKRLFKCILMSWFSFVKYIWHNYKLYINAIYKEPKQVECAILSWHIRLITQFICRSNTTLHICLFSFCPRRCLSAEFFTVKWLRTSAWLKRTDGRKSPTTFFFFCLSKALAQKYEHAVVVFSA